MSADVDTEALRRRILRIASTDGRILGTGFFVTPGWVMTCAHVVADYGRLQLSPASGGDPFEATVRARSPSPPAQWHSALWPFPDLAFLSYQTRGKGAHADSNPPVVLLDTALPSQAHDCYAWGYARREAGVDPVGSAVSMRFQGVDGDGFLTLAKGLIQPGLSGAPLVCLRARRGIDRDHAAVMV